LSVSDAGLCCCYFRFGLRSSQPCSLLVFNTRLKALRNPWPLHRDASPPAQSLLFSVAFEGALLFRLLSPSPPSLSSPLRICASVPSRGDADLRAALLSAPASERSRLRSPTPTLGSDEGPSLVECSFFKYTGNISSVDCAC